MTMQRLVGIWEGTGSGGFPTIEPFSYREVLEVREMGGILRYSQSTWRVEDAGEAGSHQETGFISLGADGTVEILNAQGSDRVEVLRGRASTNGDVLVLDLKSAVVANDDRMIRTWRTIEVDGHELRYTMGMATTQVPDGADHLTAHLTRLVRAETGSR